MGLSKVMVPLPSAKESVYCPSRLGSVVTVVGCTLAVKGITVFESLSKVMIFSSMLNVCASERVLEVQRSTASTTTIRFMVFGGKNEKREQLLANLNGLLPIISDRWEQRIFRPAGECPRYNQLGCRE